MRTAQEKVADFVRRLKEVAGDNLESAILYGSAARGQYQASRSDLNVLCTLKSLAAEELARISPVVNWWCKDEGEPAPQFFQNAELHQSADVFAIEFLDMQQSHKVLYGPDVISAISVPMNLHRVQVEHELRTLLLRLRQYFLLHAENHGDLRVFSAKSSSSVRVLLRHVIMAFGEVPPEDWPELSIRIAQLTGAHAAALETPWRWRDDLAHATEVARGYAFYMTAIAQVIEALDQKVPKSEWQRIRKRVS
ncbi:MAG TPA: hypothetical protein VLX32_05770 [Candidatus Acidoferrum sp.]|nr:hypothetical protein [Candidatus Acidoferrum sp.]